MWAIAFFSGFGGQWITKEEKDDNGIVKWNTRTEAETWAKANCGEVPYKIIKITGEG